MNRRELVRAVAAHTSLDPKQVDATLAGVTDVITAVVAKGEAVAIQGFAKFTKINRPARMARNPQTGEPVRVKAKTVAKATAMKAFRDTVMSPASAPKLARGVWPTDAALLTQQANQRKAASAPARPTAATKSTAKKSTAKKSTAKKSTARTAPAKKSTAKKSTAKKSTAKKSTAKRAPAKKSTGRR